MAHKLAGNYTFEVQVGLSGTYCPAVRQTPPSHSSGGEPGEPPHMEDVDVTGIGGLRLDRVPGQAPGGTSLCWTAIDLLKGVDRKSAAYLQIVANVLEFIGEAEAETAFSTDALEVAA